MSEETEHDYAEFKYDRLYRGRILSKKQRAKLINVINPAICTAHKISASDKHQSLMFELVYIMQTSSEVLEQDGKIVPPKDQPTVKDARKSIDDVAKHLRKAGENIHDMVENETAHALLERVPEYEGIGHLLPALKKLTEILEEARDYAGDKGARRNPDWVKMFCELCQKFWDQNMPGGTALVYQNDQESAVSEWVFALYKEIGEFTGVWPEDSMLFTHAKRLNR